jgi:hypothetical protein
LKINVPLKDGYIRQFICARYGAENNVIELNRRTFLGKLTELACQKISFAHTLPKANFDQAICITLVFPSSLKSEFIHPIKVAVMAEAMAAHFSEVFLAQMEVYIEAGLSDYTAVTHFIEKYKIDETSNIHDKLRKKWRDKQYYMKKKLESFP